MGEETGQSSPYPPTVVLDPHSSRYHMVFSANDPSNRVLYYRSDDGKTWEPGPDPGQTTSAGPALSISFAKHTDGTFRNWLILVFVSNDPSKRILYSTLDLKEDPNVVGWRFKGQVGRESAQGVFALATNPREPWITVYFTSNDPSNRLLESQFIPK
jgi:hypothetical protein